MRAPEGPGGGARAATGVTIAIPTYRRPDAVVRAVRGALSQATEVSRAGRRAGAPGPDGDGGGRTHPAAGRAGHDDRSDIDVLVIDNDPAACAAPAVRALRTQTPDGVGLRYVVEERPGVAAVRNRALDEAAGRALLVFIDDDEDPAPGWLAALLETFAATTPAAVAGPVVPVYEVEPDAWVRAGAFFERRTWPTGTARPVAATNNLLLDLDFVRAHGLRFDEAFGGSWRRGASSGGATARGCATTCPSTACTGPGSCSVSARTRRPLCASGWPWRARGPTPSSASER